MICDRRCLVLPCLFYSLFTLDSVWNTFPPPKVQKPENNQSLFFAVVMNLLCFDYDKCWCCLGCFELFLSVLNGFFSFVLWCIALDFWACLISPGFRFPCLASTAKTSCKHSGPLPLEPFPYIGHSYAQFKSNIPHHEQLPLS